MPVKVVKLEPITSVYKLREFYRNYGAPVNWLVTCHTAEPSRNCGYHYEGTLLEVLTQMDADFDTSFVADIEMQVGSVDLLIDLIENNITADTTFTIFDLQHNRQVV